MLNFSQALAREFIVIFLSMHMEQKMKEKLLEIKCKQFADEGEKFSEELRKDNLEIINSYINHYSYFNICLAIALTWTKHAKHDFGFFDYAINFFENNELLDAEEIKNYSYRFGHISLGKVWGSNLSS